MNMHLLEGASPLPTLRLITATHSSQCLVAFQALWVAGDQLQRGQTGTTLC